jgi:hypothetical protein
MRPAAPSVTPRSTSRRASVSVVAAPTTHERPWLRAGLLALCVYESVALASDRVPTVSAHMWRLTPKGRAFVWGGAALILTDHFMWRRWT